MIVCIITDEACTLGFWNYVFDDKEIDWLTWMILVTIF